MVYRNIEIPPDIIELRNTDFRLSSDPSETLNPEDRDFTATVLEAVKKLTHGVTDEVVEVTLHSGRKCRVLVTTDNGFYNNDPPSFIATPDLLPGSEENPYSLGIDDSGRVVQYIHGDNPQPTHQLPHSEMTSDAQELLGEIFEPQSATTAN